MKSDDKKNGYMVTLGIWGDCFAYTAKMLLLPYFNGGHE